MSRAIKSSLLYHAFVSFASDILISAGSTPVLYTPLLGGYPRGFWRVFNVPTGVQLGVVFISQLYTALSIMMLFYIRYDAVLPDNHHLKPRRTLMVFFFSFNHLLLLILVPLGVYWLIPDQETAKRAILEEHPNAPPSLFNDDTLILNQPSELVPLLIVVILILFVVYVAALSAFFAWYSYYTLVQRRNFLSPKTLALQRAFLLGTIRQVCANFLFLCVPGLIFFYSLIISFSNQDIMDATLLFITAHGSAGTAVMLLTSENYRKVLATTIKRICFKKQWTCSIISWIIHQFISH
ncbi:hypothetical protein Y032_0030g2236 [Ancylostoma ceylanicum]|uniref:7TM GPCR serpentine receptor class x (Srx) domain-containing protein n=1 Tax=Ancylostoma ceylanicum TaxID=53326 RepID=A0A016URA1_9BILA|nr:hypothetical protein Y032_0030g2236 [Ancylostoma ceylanicum]